MPLSTSYSVETLPKTMHLVEDMDSTQTSFKINYVPLAMTKGILIIDEGQSNEERVAFNSVTDNGDDTATLGDATRGLPFYGNTFTGSASLKFPHTGGASTVRLVVAHELINLAGYIDRANTWAAAQTFSVPFQGPTYATLAALEAAYPTPTNGQQSVYCTLEGQIYDAVGGAWVARASGTNPNGSTTVAGKYEAGTDTEVDAATQTGTTGALLAVMADSASIVKRNRWRFTDFSEKTIASGAITVTAPLHTVDTEADAASDDLDTITAAYGSGEVIHLKAENTSRTVVIKHGTGNIKLADAADFSLDDTEKSITLIRKSTEWHELSRGRGAAAAATYFDKTVYLGKTTSAEVGESSTAEANFGTNSYTIPSGELINNVAYEVEAAGNFEWASGTLAIRLKLGSTQILRWTVTPAANGKWTVKGTIYGTAAAGASANIVAHGTLNISNNSVETNSRLSVTEIVTADLINVATNGNLVLQLSAEFSASSSSNGAFLSFLKVRKISTSAF